MAPQDEASRWLQQAQQEIRDAEDLRRRERFYLALFLCQPAAEKAQWLEESLPGKVPGTEFVLDLYLPIAE
jgi:HEPN domain-containing protein